MDTRLSARELIQSSALGRRKVAVDGGKYRLLFASQQRLSYPSRKVPAKVIGNFRVSGAPPEFVRGIPGSGHPRDAEDRPRAARKNAGEGRSFPPVEALPA